MTTRAVLYARVSGDDRKNEGRNLKGQLQLCREYAHKKQWQVVDELAEDDRGASGVDVNLPELTKMLDMARNREFDVLVVREIDRLSRDIGKQYLIEGELKQANIRIAYVLGEYPNTPEGELQKAIKAAIASYERTKITERSVRGRRREAKRGSVMAHGRPPYGYKLEHKDNRYQLVINEEKARIVRMAYEWYTGLDKMAIRGICHRLNDMGIPSPGGKTWAASTLSRILTSETYAGVWHYGKQGSNGYNDPSHYIPIEVPAIVDRQTWEIAQKRKKTNKQQSARNTHRQYLLRSRAICGDCKRAMRLATTGKTSPRYYCCSRKYDALIPKPCNHNTHYRQEIVDKIAWL